MANRTHIDEQGRRWDSKFEWRIADWCERNGVEYTAQPRSFDYGTPVANAKCVGCGSTKIVKSRSYTPDFLLAGQDYYIEAKGYLRPDARSLLQHFAKARPDVPIRFVFQENKSLPLKRTPDYRSWGEKYGVGVMIWSDKKGLSEWLK